MTKHALYKKKSLAFLLPALCALACVGAAAAETLGERFAFPHAEPIEQNAQQDALRIYPQGTLRRISNQVRYEAQIRAEGMLHSLTLRLPDGGQELASALAETRESLHTQGAPLLYWCEGRECGSSALWANTVFGNARLYGPDDQQSYLLYRLPGQDSLLAFYAITRGNRRSYLHIEQLDSPAALGELLPAATTLLRQLREKGSLALPLPEPSPVWAERLAQTLNLASTMRVRLEGRHASAWQQALLAQRVRASRLEAAENGEDGLTLVWLR